MLNFHIFDSLFALPPIVRVPQQIPLPDFSELNTTNGPPVPLLPLCAYSLPVHDYDLWPHCQIYCIGFGILLPFHAHLPNPTPHALPPHRLSP